ncbi:MAG: AAA family ATPase [Hyphomicrobiales bacterium]|nr:AAA family ATPase [Hyphomicrobiales bacterium]
MKTDDTAEFEVSPHLAPVPRISLQAFCESPELASTISEAASDRRMDKAHVKVHMGGAPAAIEAFRNSPTPNVIVLEADENPEALYNQLEELSHFCDSGTKVMIVGAHNDIALYRSLMSRGVSDYLVMPLSVLDFIGSVSRLYAHESGDSLGRIIAFVGAKGGVGSSTLAHNVAWSIARSYEMQTVIVDLDLPFGTAGLDFNQDPPQGVADAVYAPDRVDANMLDRLLTKCSDHLSLLAAPATLEKTADFSEGAFDVVFDVLRQSVPCIIADVPHLWTDWSKRLLTIADEVVVVASPDLANLRNAKSMLDLLRAARPNDHLPRLIINGSGVQKRPEIEIAEFAKAVDLQPLLTIPFDPKLFGTATNNGQMIAEVEATNKTAESFVDIGRILMGRSEIKKSKKGILANPLLAKLLRKAS